MIIINDYSEKHLQKIADEYFKPYPQTPSVYKIKGAVFDNKKIKITCDTESYIELYKLISNAEEEMTEVSADVYRAMKINSFRPNFIQRAIMRLFKIGY